MDPETRELLQRRLDANVIDAARLGTDILDLPNGEVMVRQILRNMDRPSGDRVGPEGVMALQMLVEKIAQCEDVSYAIMAFTSFISSLNYQCREDFTPELAAAITQAVTVQAVILLDELTR